jgi:hypothetical protein
MIPVMMLAISRVLQSAIQLRPYVEDNIINPLQQVPGWPGHDVRRLMRQIRVEVTAAF